MAKNPASVLRQLKIEFAYHTVGQVDIVRPDTEEAAQVDIGHSEAEGLSQVDIGHFEAEEDLAQMDIGCSVAYSDFVPVVVVGPAAAKSSLSFPSTRYIPDSNYTKANEFSLDLRLQLQVRIHFLCVHRLVISVAHQECDQYMDQGQSMGPFV